MDTTAAGEKRVAVVGAGITGLATAFLLARERPGWRVEVFEAEARVGGKARTSTRDGYTFDWGPNGFLTTAPETLELARQLGLEAELRPASEAARHRFLYVDGGLRPVPPSPQAFLASEVVPLPGRMRAALELAVAGRHDGEESVHAFLARHFGRSFADALADAFVSGITAGDSRELSLDALFPRLRAMERAHGSLLRALIAQQRAARKRRRAAAAAEGPHEAATAAEPGVGTAPESEAGAAAERHPGGETPATPSQTDPQGAAGEESAAGADGGPPQGNSGAAPAPEIPAGRLTSFREGGMQRLLDALAGALPQAPRLRAPVESLAPAPEDAGGYLVSLPGAAPERFDAVVLTVPAPNAAALLRPHAPAAAAGLDTIPYAGLRVFGLGFDRIDVPRPLDGFGFLVPRRQGVRSLGVLYTSTLYPGRAPEGKVLLRVLAGGRLDPEMLELTDDEALAAVRNDLRVSMGVVAEPEFVESVRWERAIPQYTLGHLARQGAIEAELRGMPGLHLAGNAFRGVGVNDCVRDAKRVVAALLEEQR